MTRKLLIRVVSIYFMAMGLWNISAFFFPIFVAPKPTSLNLFILLLGILLFRAGSNLFKLNNFGRILILGLLSIRVLVNALGIFWSLLFPRYSFFIAIGSLNGEPFFKSENPYLIATILFAWLVMAVLTIIFLAQSETKKMFVSEVVLDEDSRTLVESSSNS